MGVHLLVSEQYNHFVIIDRKTIWISDHEILAEQKGGYYARDVNPNFASEIITSIHQNNTLPEEGIFMLDR